MKTDDPASVWEIYPGDELRTLALPDYYSTYLGYTFDAAQHPRTCLRITGEFPDARYMSFNIYATKEATSLGALTDYQIRTPSPEGNPFVAGHPRTAGGEESRYVVHVQPARRERQESDATAPAAPAPGDPDNLLTFHPGQLKDGQLTVVIRYYVPRKGDLAGVPLPTVEAYDVDNPDTSRPVPPSLPGRMDLHEPIFRHRMKPIFQSARGDELRFYHVIGGGQFNNADNIYLISAAVGVDGRNNVVILRVRPPSHPVTNDEFDQTAVRYWSFNQGDPDTSTPFGMKDEQFRPAKDGFVYVVMGDEDCRAPAERGGYNFMPWRADNERAVILYRNMLTAPQYRGSIARVPQLPVASSPVAWDEKLLVSHEAARHIGEYAPAGRKVTARDFHDSYGGLHSPGFA